MPTRRKPNKPSSAPAWRRMDLHLHTPASADYRESNVTYLDILKKAEQKGLDIIAISDHNTAAGYRRYIDEIEDLELLERRNRLTDEEKLQLQEFRRLREKVLVLPAFELTCTLGFHVLGIFPPETTVRELEHLLLDLHVPPEKLDVGSGEVGATSDVLTAYRLINEAGGLAIAAHANSSHGVAMPGFDFGGQTRIAYTQDENLHALEVTDLASKSRRRTQLFFSGTKPEYPRKMHCIQGSDAHRLNGISGNNQELGVGDRPTEVLLPDVSFDALMDVFLGKDFSKTRPYVPAASHEFDPLFNAREEGDTLVQAFHESIGKHGIERKILQDVVALANTNGGTIYIGASANIRLPVQGVIKPLESSRQLQTEINRHIVPPLEVQIDTLKSAGKQILQVIVPRGTDVPYALDATQIYVRSENETSLAVRDEIVNLVRDAVAVEFAGRVENAPLATVQAVEQAETIVQKLEDAAATPRPSGSSENPTLPSPPPHTGVEIVSSKARRDGRDRSMQYTMRDLRNSRIIHNVTRSSARKLWQYAITEHERLTSGTPDIKWLGDVGLLKASERVGKLRYDLVQRDSNGELHVYYGVTDDGIHGAWKDLVESPAGQSPVIELEEEEPGAPEPEGEELQPTLDLSDNGENGESTETPTTNANIEEEIAAAPTEETAPGMTLGVASSSVEPLAVSALAAPETAEPEPVAALDVSDTTTAPKLITTPGRDLLPPPYKDLTASTLETDDVPSTHAAVVSTESIALEAPPPDAAPDMVTAQAAPEATAPPAAARNAAAENVGAPVETSEAGSAEHEISTASTAEPIAEIAAMPAEPPHPVAVATAETNFAEPVATTVVSGDSFAPIREHPRGTPAKLPEFSINFDEQIVLPHQ